MTYRIEGLDPARFANVEALLSAGAIRMTVDKPGAFPCRVTLEDAEPGESVLLVNHVSADVATPFRASHAIFVREGAVRAPRYRDVAPPLLERRRLSLRAFDAMGMLRTGALRSAEREDGTSTVAAVSAYAIALVEVGEHRRAAELFGAVDTLGPRYGFHPVASDGSYAAPYRDRAADELGPTEWDAALLRGRDRDLRWAVAQLT